MTAAEGNPALNECRTRLELTAARVRDAVRAKVPTKPPRPLHETACRLCRQQGHRRGTCPLRRLRPWVAMVKVRYGRSVHVWIPGDDVCLARSRRDAVDIERVTWHPPMRAPRQIHWQPLAPAPDGRFTIAGVTAELRAWARANGRGMLAAGGRLLPGRKVPR